MSNTNKKTNRKNKTNLVVKNWPSGFFTYDELHALNPDFIIITLRSHVNVAKEENKVAVIGTLHVAKGRPKSVLALTPVSSETLEKARNAGVVFNENYNSIAVVDVDSVKLQEEQTLYTPAEEVDAEPDDVEIIGVNN